MMTTLPTGARAWLARPTDRPDAPGVVVLHEIWGLDAHVRGVADRLAAAGYAALAPDLFGLDVTLAEPVLTAGFRAVMTIPPSERAIPGRVFAALPIAGAARHSAQNIAFHEVGRQAVMADPEWKGGVYFRDGSFPRRGLAVARMASHIISLRRTGMCGASSSAKRGPASPIVYAAATLPK